MKMIDDKIIVELHLQGMTNNEIAIKLGCHCNTISKHLVKMGYKTRCRIDHSKVKELHEKGYTDLEIANLLNCSRPNITHILNKMGITDRKDKYDNIELRNRISQSLIGRYVGELNSNYKGYTDETTIARGIFKTISKEMLRSHNYTCEICGKHGGNLATHHIKPFSVILSEFLEDTYSGNINNLYKELTNYPDFTDKENLVVVCQQCHYNIHYSDNHELNPYRWGSATTIEKQSCEKDT